MTFKSTITTFLFMAFLSMNVFGQGYLSTNGTAIVNESGDTVILRGMGLGGWMLQEGYMLQTAGIAGTQWQIRNRIEQLIGEADTDLFYEKWLENHVRKIDIDSLKAWGFNSVRLPMHYKLYTPPIEDEPVIGEITWREKGFELTDSLLSWCKQNELYLILDLHGAPGGQGANADISDYDPSKPSLWESQRNKDKAVALWKRLAERYADEPWIGGYDLLNEVNWNLPGGTALRNLYGDMTDAIRSVDTKHIIFIEGNWFANDFTGLTPPWDDNLVYSPHKYWSFNDPKGIDWILPLRDNFNVPIWFGENGENSNTWFRDAIRLFENNDIGWCWWPMKKVESISGPLSVLKSPGYQAILDYWNGNGPAPSQQEAVDGLMDLTENLKLENCDYHKDVIDAMFRQVYSTETVPYADHTVPGVIHASDFDMGQVGYAYHDHVVGTYQINTGNFTAWNTGWAYRNDGVDIQPLDDNVNSNGYNVGWLAEGEWMQYTVEVENDAVYEAKVRIASAGDNGTFHFRSGDAAVSEVVSTPNTGGWEAWETITVENIILTKEDSKLRFYVNEDGFNLSSFELIETAPINSLNTEFLSAKTLDEFNVELILNKPLIGPVAAQLNDFDITVNGSSITINDIELNANNSRIISFNVDHEFQFDDVIKISYSGTAINAVDDTPLNTFNLEDVENNIPNTHPIPGKIEAEDYFNQQGVSLETTTDVGGGQNVGFLDAGDYMDYLVNVAQGGVYEVNYRNASDGGNGGLKLQLIDDDGFVTDLHQVDFTSTGGWQTWTDQTANVTLMPGIQHLRIEITASPFNINYMEFNLLTDTEEENEMAYLNVFPNPTSNHFLVQAELLEQQNVELNILNNLGQIIFSKKINDAIYLNEKVDLSAFAAGYYFMNMRMENGGTISKKIMKIAK